MAQALTEATAEPSGAEPSGFVGRKPPVKADEPTNPDSESGCSKSLPPYSRFRWRSGCSEEIPIGLMCPLNMFEKAV